MTDTDVPVLALPADVVPASIPAIERETDALLGPSGTRLVVDLAQVRFLSSSALGHLVKLGKRLHDRGGRLTLARPVARLERLLCAVGLDGVLPAFRSLEEAARHASEPRG